MNALQLLYACFKSYWTNKYIVVEHLTIQWNIVP